MTGNASALGQELVCGEIRLRQHWADYVAKVAHTTETDVCVCVTHPRSRRRRVKCNNRTHWNYKSRCCCVRVAVCSSAFIEIVSI